MDDQLRIVASEVVEEQWDLEADRALQVTQTVGNAYKLTNDVVVVKDLKTLRLAL